MIGATLSTIILAGVMSAFLMLGRSGVNAANYSMSEAEIRRTMEEFGQDVRMASGIVWNGTTSVTLTVPTQYPAFENKVTYAYDDSTTGNTARSFYRMPGPREDGAVGDRTVLVRNVTRTEFRRYNRLDGKALSDRETKRVQLILNVRRTGRTLVATNTSVISASYVLRNKIAQ